MKLWTILNVPSIKHNNQTKTMYKLILLILLIVVALAVSPLLIIWSLNTLFPTLVIPYTIWTWLAALVLFASVSYKSK